MLAYCFMESVSLCKRGEQRVAVSTSLPIPACRDDLQQVSDFFTKFQPIFCNFALSQHLLDPNKVFKTKALSLIGTR